MCSHQHNNSDEESGKIPSSIFEDSGSEEKDDVNLVSFQSIEREIFSETSLGDLEWAERSRKSAELDTPTEMVSKSHYHQVYCYLIN
jgi:hypothetical protein